MAASYVSDLFDFTVTADNLKMNIPLRAGYYFIVTRVTFLYETGAGTATGSHGFSIGNNATHDNVVSVSNVAANLNAIIPRVPNYQTLGGGGLSGLIDAGTKIVGKSTAPTGVTTLTGRILLEGQWVTTR